MEKCIVLSNLFLAKKKTLSNQIITLDLTEPTCEFKFQRSYPISKTSDNSRVGGRGRAKAGNFAALTSFTFLFFFRHRVEVYSLYGRALWSPYARSLWKIAAHFAIWRPVGLPWCNMDVNGMGSEVIKTARLNINGDNHETRLHYICRLWK